MLIWFHYLALRGKVLLKIKEHTTLFSTENLEQIYLWANTVANSNLSPSGCYTARETHTFLGPVGKINIVCLKLQRLSLFIVSLPP